MRVSSIYAWAADISSSGAPCNLANSIRQVWQHGQLKAAMDTHYNVRPVITAFFTADTDEMVMRGSPCEAMSIPITQHWDSITVQRHFSSDLSDTVRVAKGQKS